jgi:hypothetical protein
MTIRGTAVRPPNSAMSTSTNMPHGRARVVLMLTNKRCPTKPA